MKCSNLEGCGGHTSHQPLCVCVCVCQLEKMKQFKGITL